MLEISLREIRPCLRKARMTSASAAFTKIGAFKWASFFVLVAGLVGKVCTIHAKDVLSDERIKGYFHYSDLDCKFNSQT